MQCNKCVVAADGQRAQHRASQTHSTVTQSDLGALEMAVWDLGAPPLRARLRLPHCACHTLPATPCLPHCCGSFNVRVPRSDCPQAEPAVFALLAGWAGAAVRSLAARFCWLRRGARRA
eukprot:256469-Chlamydomonas_euryale.AAC.1